MEIDAKKGKIEEKKTIRRLQRLLGNADNVDLRRWYSKYRQVRGFRICFGFGMDETC